MRRRPYRDLSTTTLRATIAVLSRLPDWLFERRVGEMKLELLERELPLIADRCGGFITEWVLGVQ